MKVILLKDDKKLGKRNTIIEVADGYARNVLIPKGVVEEVNSTNLSKLNNRISNEKWTYDKTLEKAKETKENLIKLNKITIFANGAENGKMFGSITTKSISDALKEKGFEIDKHNIGLKNNINNFGEYSVKIKLLETIYAEITVEVIKKQL